MAGDWKRVERDLRWVLDRRNNAAAFAEMDDALRANDVNTMGAVKDAFHKSQSSTPVQANFDACATENQGRLYNLGRAILRLPAV
jgi:hypothetical protein